MSEKVISVIKIHKAYQIYDKPYDRLKQFLYRGRKTFFKSFNALNEISFEVNKGETVGIIGCNGSGKSTLLQIICGTLSPTSGTIHVNGRVAALLELGAGFNPEFTGRENIYMYAAIYGLDRETIDEKYDDIVKFADIGSFIEQPVKTYSSGMFVRLAFAVIAHVDADILIIDESLSVGDAIFVQKCMRFLRNFQKKGTLLFVSHDVSAVRNFCKTALWLHAGVIQKYGDAKSVTERYTQFCFQSADEKEIATPSIHESDEKKEHQIVSEMTAVSEKDDIQAVFFDNIAHSEGWKTGGAEIKEVFFLNEAKKKTSLLKGGESITLVIKGVAHRMLSSPIIGFIVKDRLGQSLFGENTFRYIQPPLCFKPTQYFEGCFDFTLPLLPDGDYSITVSIADGDPIHHTQHHWLHDALIFKVSSNKLRYGLVGIPFSNVKVKVFS